MASESHVDRSIETPRSFIENNVMLALSMLDYARSLDNLKLFIQVSTDEVYGPVDNGEGPHKEYDSMLPSNPYSASKASQEAIAIAYWKTYDLPVVITNTMNNIGERQDPEKFVPKTIKSFLTNAEVSVHGRVVEDVWYPGTRHYLDARNYASALIFIINRLHSVPVKSSEGVTRPHRYHIPGEREVSNLEMVELICKHLEADPSLIKLHNADSSRPGYDKNYGLDPGTLKTLGWTPPFTFEESIERVINWSAKNPHWLE
jgi:dTDP-glucose 4,6-dehydratase